LFTKLILVKMQFFLPLPYLFFKEQYLEF